MKREMLLLAALATAMILAWSYGIELKKARFDLNAARIEAAECRTGYPLVMDSVRIAELISITKDAQDQSRKHLALAGEAIRQRNEVTRQLREANQAESQCLEVAKRQDALLVDTMYRLGIK